MSRTALVASVITIVALSMSFDHAQDALRAPTQAVPQSTTPPQRQTLKERLSDKASDEQRVDNCKVPVLIIARCLWTAAAKKSAPTVAITSHPRAESCSS
jgi:hypothetical protein